MWVSKKKWEELEKRVADLEGQVQSQPQEIIDAITERLLKQTTKSIRPRHQGHESQSAERV